MIDPKLNNQWKFPNPIYTNLEVVKKLIYDPCQFECSDLTFETESLEYAACSFKLNSMRVKFRVAKITPTKIGQFVTLWKRVNNGPIQPYDISDEVEFFIITTRKNNNFGQFVFPKSVLYQYGIISNNGKGGKRAIRVYPPWDITINPQAKNTQTWQLQYFLEAQENIPIDIGRTKNLFNQKIVLYL